MNIDPMRFYGQLYKDLLLELTRVLDDKSLVTPLFLKCIHKMIVARSKQVSQHRLLAFTKRLATLALHQDHPTALSFIASLRKLLLLTPKTELLYENEGLGSGVYLPEMEDPEYCKPEASALWDLHLLKNHYHPTVASVAVKILQHHPLKTEHKLTPEISLKDPVELFELYSTIQEKEDGYPANDFRPSLVSLSKTKIQTALRKSKSSRNAIFRIHRFADEQFGMEMNSIFDSVPNDLDRSLQQQRRQQQQNPTDALTMRDAP